MKYLTKANTALMRELEQKIIDVLKSFAYDEVVGNQPEKEIFPERYFERDKLSLTATIEGEIALCADAEIATVVINSMLASEIDEFDLKMGHASVNMDVKGEMSVLEELDEDSDETDDVLAVLDLLDGYGLLKFTSVDLSLKHENEDGVSFKCFAGEKELAHGGRKGSLFTVTFNLAEITEYKLSGKEFKDPVSVVLVASDIPDTAYQVAFGLRRQGLRAEGYISGGSMTDAEEYCALKGIPTLIWAGDETVTMKNIETGESAETTLEKLLGK